MITISVQTGLESTGRCSGCSHWPDVGYLFSMTPAKAQQATEGLYGINAPLSTWRPRAAAVLCVKGRKIQGGVIQLIDRNGEFCGSSVQTSDLKF